MMALSVIVIPAKAGTQFCYIFCCYPWVPAFAGMTLLATADDSPPLGFGMSYPLNPKTL